MKNENYEYDDYDDDLGCFVWMGIGLLCFVALILYLML